tara:strand:+ start:347 stop:517 length:171 start_codon:yes stop_codon:yes gene_type:complete
MDIKKALMFRRDLISKYGKFSPEVQVYSNIMNGSYDAYKEEAFNVATEDVAFLKKK